MWSEIWCHYPLYGFWGTPKFWSARLGRPLQPAGFQSTMGKKKLLVITDQLMGWVGAYATGSNLATKVAKILIQEILPRYMLPEGINPYAGSRFVK